jgi:hypothetical protein
MTSSDGSERVAALQRWEDLGAVWRVVGQGQAGVTVALCRCDGGEEVERFTSDDPALLSYLGGRTSSEDEPGPAARSRERDARGRAQNARPRDALGRPLPRGAEGVPRVPDDLVLPPLPALTEAQRLLDQRMPFHAHEVLEGTWKAAPPAERDLWQGLAQLAVGFTHLLRGNPAGTTTLLRRAQRRISGYAADPPYGVDVPGLLGWTDAVLAGLASGADPHQVPTPQLRGTRGQGAAGPS